MLRTTSLLFGVLTTIITGCASTREIETSSPRPPSLSGATRAGTPGMGLLSIDLETGETALPADVQVLRFRVEEVRLHMEGGEWITFPTELNSFEILPDRYLGKTILSTRVQPAAYDSIALKISNAFVLFGENAGGPLTLPRDNPLTIAVETTPQVGQAAQVRISIEPGASLFRDDKCRWYFVPFWTAGAG